MSAGSHDVAYKRLLKPFSVPAGGGTFKLATSFDLEADYDYIFVEIHTAGQDDWTTLADEDDHTSDDVGLSCPSTGDGSDWQSNHPFLAHYQTKISGGDDCDPTGSSGSWNAATGNSGGWQEWSMPIPAAYHGENVEISVSVVSDPAVQGLGAWVDQMRLEDSGGAPVNSADPSFESGEDGWTTPGPPPPAGAGGQSQETGWERAAERAVRRDADHDHRRHGLHGLRLRSRHRRRKPRRADGSRPGASRPALDRAEQRHAKASEIFTPSKR